MSTRRARRRRIRGAVLVTSVLLALGGMVGVATGAIGCRQPFMPAPSLSPGVEVPRERGPGTPGWPSNALGTSPLVSRGRPVAARSAVHFSKAKSINDGDLQTTWDAGRPTPDEPAWIAIDIGAGPRRVLLTWKAGGSFNYEETVYGSPGAYRIETSADSTDGQNGVFTIAVHVDVVLTHAQQHALDFAGKRWIRLVVTTAPAVSPNGVQLDEIEVRDISSGLCDAWFFMGDSITATAFGRAASREPDFAERIRSRHSDRLPAVLNGGMGGETSLDGARHIEEWLARSPDVEFWAIAYGTNDAAGNNLDVAPFKKNLTTILLRIQAAGKRAIVATIPFASDGQHVGITHFNQVIEELRQAFSLPPGPDLYGWFEAHPEQLRDGVHPTDAGVASINRLWAQAAEAFYRR